MKLYEHQEKTRAFGRNTPAMLDASDPGTGKTIANLAIFNDRFLENPNRRLLVLCPKTIMTLAWGRDIQAAFPHLSYSLANADNRAPAFAAKTNVVIMNHDGVTWLKNNPQAVKSFTDLIIDESTAYKNRQNNRSKALRELCDTGRWERKSALTGTPMPLGVCDIWHQIRILDGGERLGKNFCAFQSACCDAKPNGHHLKWVDKPGINDVVMQLIGDITIRHELERCIDMPEHVQITLPTTLSPKHRKAYTQLERDAILELQEGTVTALHAGALRQKMLQLLSGAVYTSSTDYELVDDDRYNLVLDLVEQRSASIVAFTWKHQRDWLAKLANERGMHFAIMDSDTDKLSRVRIIDAFQRGELQMIIGHPGTMGHGVTATRGVATIWPSPTDNAEHFIQMNRRVYRNGQTQRTETIMIAAEETIEVPIYERLLGKVSRQQDFLDLLLTLDNSPLQPDTTPTTESANA